MIKSNLEEKNVVAQSNVLNLLDFCKGLAIVWVFLIHLKGGWFGWQGVHIFRVLSGFGLTYSCLRKKGKISWRQWYIKRSERILPSYWLISLVGFILTAGICLSKYIGNHHKLIFCIKRDITNLIFDIFIFRDLDNSRMSGLPNHPLWYIPFILSFYIIFPWLYAQVVKCRTAKSYIIILVGSAVVEFIYRAISIYWFDGTPIGYNDVLLTLPVSAERTTLIQVPFGLFPSRMAEFMLGMLAARILVKNPVKFNKNILNYQTTIAGMLIGLGGNLLLFVGLWGWIFADFVIALGLILWTVNLAWACQQRFSLLFSYLTWLGIYSYGIYLTHYLFLYIIEDSITVATNSLSFGFIQVLMFGLISVGTVIASWGLGQFDKSRYAKLIMQKTLGVFLKA